MLPSKLEDSLKSRRHTIDEDYILYEGVHQHCQSQDEIYLDDGLSTGYFAYDYEWMSTDAMNRFRFYGLMESRYTHKSLGNASEEEDATNYVCHTDFVAIDGRPWRMSACTRAYRDYAGLYDALLMMASVGNNDRGVIIRLGAAGISRKNAVGLLEKFTGSIAWTS